jgi:hypothetical protein
VVTAGYNSLSCLLGKLVAQIGSDGGLISEALLHLWKFFGIGNSCATTASTSDGSLAMTYLPTIRTITVDMSKEAHRLPARDPAGSDLPEGTDSELTTGCWCSRPFADALMSLLFHALMDYARET